MKNPEVGQEVVVGVNTIVWTGQFWMDAREFTKPQVVHSEDAQFSVEATTPPPQNAGMFSLDGPSTMNQEGDMQHKIAAAQRKPREPLFDVPAPSPEVGQQAEPEEKRRRFGRKARALGAAALLAVTSVFTSISPTRSDEVPSVPETVEVDETPEQEVVSSEQDDTSNMFASVRIALTALQNQATPEVHIQHPQEGLISSQSIISVGEGDTVSKIVLEDIFGVESVESGTMDPVVQNNPILRQIFVEGMAEFQRNNTSITNIDRIHPGQTLQIGGYSDDFLKKAEKGYAAYQSLRSQG